jgi:hypothetical protein
MMYVWRLSRLDAAGPERLVAQLRLARWAAVLLSANGAVSIGLAIANDPAAFGPVDVALGVAFIVFAGAILSREPREALLLAAAGFLAHALTNIAHRPGWLWPGIAPRWYAVGSATYDVCMAALCYGARRR